MEKKIKLFALPIVCSPKIIEYYAESKEDAINQFLEENPAFEKNDIWKYDIKEIKEQEAKGGNDGKED